jgi:hypothetical protein
MGEGAGGHGARHLFADRAHRRKERLRYAEEFRLGGVRISDESALHD